MGSSDNPSTPSPPPGDIARGYDQLADHWYGDAFDRQDGIDQHRRALAFCAGKGAALDVGCGSSGRIIDLLQAEGFRVDGVDLSPRMIELARRRHPDCSFYLADICRWTLPRRYDLISAWDSIWHVPLDVHEAVLRKLLGGLQPGGVCIFSMGGLDEAAEKTDSAMGPPMYYSTLGIANTLRLIDEAGCRCRHLEYDQHPELHVYVIAQRRPS